MNSLILRFVKFSGSTVVGTVVDTIVLFLLSEWVFTTYAGEFLIAPTISFEAAVLNNFLFGYFWVWTSRVSRTAEDFARRFLVYNLHAGLVFAGKLGLLIVINLLTGLHVVVCNLLALTMSGIVNFLVQDRLVFSNREIPSPDSSLK